MYPSCTPRPNGVGSPPTTRPIHRGERLDRTRRDGLDEPTDQRTAGPRLRAFVAAAGVFGCGEHLCEQVPPSGHPLPLRRVIHGLLTKLLTGVPVLIDERKERPAGFMLRPPLLVG
jgi:hypothetical protein